jgi:hypothetical protein
MWETRHLYRYFERNSQEKIPNGSYMHGRWDNIKTGLREIVCKDVD